MHVHVFVNACDVCSGVLRGQRRALDPLELDDLDPLEKQVNP